jgi:nucleotide-binding universal stress UspA family protein
MTDHREAEMATETNGNELVVRAQVPGVEPDEVSGYAPEVMPNAEAVAAEAVEGIDEQLRATGHALSGAPAPAIVDACEQAGADLLVAGSRGYGPVTRVLLGSVSKELVHRAPCPVLVAPRP